MKNDLVRLDIKDRLLVSLDDAAEAVGKTPHNIRDYIQRGRIGKYNLGGDAIEKAAPGQLRIDLHELQEFLKLVAVGEEKHHHAGLNAELGFYGLAERERTKHVHRVHPYLGKFIPQLVEWFLANYFHENDIIIDPFMGSGTTLVQSNEMKMHSIGVDVSDFNCLIARVKTAKYSVQEARKEILEVEGRTSRFSRRLVSKSPEYPLFDDEDFDKFKQGLLAECDSDYLRKWFAPRALLQMLYYRRLIHTGTYKYGELLRVLLSRAVRSSRLIPHNDLATPKAPLPVGIHYWCKKHNRMCLPIADCITKIHAYSEDTARRIGKFNELRSDKTVTVLRGDSRSIDLSPYLNGRKANGIFTSPPYVGQIDYHDQHIYAYELFGIPRQCFANNSSPH